MCIIDLFGHEPFIHLLNFVLSMPLLSLCYVEQLLTNFVLGLLYEFAFKTALSIFVAQPLLVVQLWLERYSLRLLVHFVVKFISSIRTHLSLRVDSFEFFLINLKSFFQNLADRQILIVVSLVLLVNQPVHVVVSC